MIHQSFGKFVSNDFCKLHALLALLLIALVAIQGLNSLLPNNGKTNLKANNNIREKYKSWKKLTLFGKNKKKRNKKRSKPDNNNDHQIHNLWWKMKQMVFDTKRSINALRRLNPVRR